jgi:hypothetical protein
MGPVTNLLQFSPYRVSDFFDALSVGLLPLDVRAAYLPADAERLLTALLRGGPAK